jgi:hypothetical protein
MTSSIEAENCYDECINSTLYAEYRYAECRYAECRGAMTSMPGKFRLN